MAEIIVLSLLALASGVLLGFASVKYKVEGNPMVEKINALLPQTQCGQCSYAGCRPYAEAIANNEAEINLCPPGGEAVVVSLSELLGKEIKPLEVEEKVPSMVYIREQECIGCTLCIQACPVDAILGAAKQMHTVITDECTGCNLCISPCPVDCIDIIPIKTNVENWVPQRPKTYRNLRAI